MLLKLEMLFDTQSFIYLIWNHVNFLGLGENKHAFILTGTCQTWKSGETLILKKKKICWEKLIIKVSLGNMYLLDEYVMFFLF